MWDEINSAPHFPIKPNYRPADYRTAVEKANEALFWIMVKHMQRGNDGFGS